VGVSWGSFALGYVAAAITPFALLWLFALFLWCADKFGWFRP